MSILIRNMEMPQSCFDCPLSYVFPYSEDNFMVKCAPLNRKTSEDTKRNDCPLIEVPEQKHGKWIYYNTIKTWDGWEHRQYRCSLCGRFTTDNDLFCPNCGARMDGE